jgi:hypothetical protein
MSAPNIVLWEDFRNELSALIEDELRRLTWWLSDNSASSATWHTASTWLAVNQKELNRTLRFAPSLLIRTELDVLHGGSSPRFAFRYDLGSQGFLNLRRLQQLKTVLEKRYVSTDGHFPFPPGATVEEWEKAKISDLNIEKCPSVAESFLMPPARFSKVDYHLVTAQLAPLFGETDPPESSDADDKAWRGPEGIPYLRTPPFGVGLCAQACCFISTLLMHQHASQVHGLGEVTALLTNTATPLLPIRGLYQIEMVQYFQKVGLSSMLQFQDYNQPPGAERNDRAQPRQAYQIEECLHAYVASGFPVVMCLDPSRMPSKEDALPLEPETEPGKVAATVPPWDAGHAKVTPLTVAEHHAITVVGCSKRKHLRPERIKHSANHAAQWNIPESTYIYQDSSFMPFTSVNARVLLSAGYRAPEARTIEGGSSQGLHPQIISVTPPAVTVPLLNWIDDQEVKHDGLLRIMAFYPAFSRYRTLPEQRSFYLMQLDDPRLEGRLLEFFTIAQAEKVGPHLEQLKNLSNRMPWAEKGKRWVWLEVGVREKGMGAGIHKLIKVWDAQVDLSILCSLRSNAARPFDLLRGVLELPYSGDGAWNWNPCEAAPTRPTSATTTTTTTESEATPPKKDELGEVLPALISSFEFRGRHAVQHFLPEKAKFIEYYACMHGDLSEYFGEEFRRHPSALHVLAGMGERVDADDQAEKFGEWLRDSFPHRHVIAIATFFPEITSPDESLRKAALHAIQFLVKTARHLPRFAQRPFVIELVSGSMVESVAKRRDQHIPEKDRLPDDQRLSFGMLPRSSYRKNVEGVLSDFAAVADEALAADVLFAIELEPGPLFRVNSAETLETLCEAIALHPAEGVKRTMGVNLDIPHWAILSRPNPGETKRITSEWLRSTPAVLNRVVHAHISDHGIGHLSDLFLTCQSKEEFFRPWLEILRRRSFVTAKPPFKGLPFSGFISIEHEACKSARQLSTSFELLQKWLGQ